MLFNQKHVIAIAAVLIAAALVLAPHSAMAFYDATTMASVKPFTAMTLAISAAATEPLAFNIREFCTKHGISVPTYYEMKRQGLGPAEMRFGRVIRISSEAAAAWRHARENPTKIEAEGLARAADALRQRARQAAKHAIASEKHVSRRNEVA